MTRRNEDIFVFPASFAQRRLWFIDQLDPGNPVYNLPLIYRVTGKLNVDALKRSLNEVIRRHEALRTGFALDNGEPVQIINPKLDLPLPLLDLTDYPEDQREAKAFDLIDEEIHCRFDLASGPLVRAKLIRLDEEYHILILSMHHIICDEWSLEVLLKELKIIYEAFVEGQLSPLDKPPLQYADFTMWQRERLQGNVLEEQLAYWKRKLAGLPASLNLPADYALPARQSFRGAYRTRTLPLDLLKSLQTFSRQEQVTLFMTLLTVFQVLLHRYTGQEDIVVGSPMTNRNRIELEGVIGFCLNMLALRNDLSGNPSFRQLLKQVRRTALEGYEHQDLPFERLVEEFRTERDPYHTPVFQAAFSLLDVQARQLELGGLVAEKLDIHLRISKFDLTLFAGVEAESLKVRFEYSTDLFAASAIERMIDHFQTLLEGIIANPDQPIGQLSLLTEGERRQVITEWNDTHRDYPRERYIHQIFEVQVKQNPEATAIIWEEQSLTFGELNRRSNQLAVHLQNQDVKRGDLDLVGICMERSPDMIVAMLGILKAGGAYVPLDPNYPPERLVFMLEDTQATVLLTHTHLLDLFHRQSVVPICMDRDWNSIAQHSIENLEIRSNALDPAYVMYTSGSTGQPKGVTIPHRAVARLVSNTDYIDLKPGDRIAQASTASFDAATFEIWGALLNGGTLVGINQDVLLSPRDFARQIREHKIDVLFLTTALFNQIAAEAPDSFAPVRDLLFGGEAVDPKWVQAVLKNGPPKRLLHVYGPTENTTFTTWYPVKTVEETGRTIPIGRPIANTQVYLLDHNLQPVPVGVPGELYTGGDGLAKGYLNDPQLTAAKFIANPFSDKTGSMLYKTGDLARYRPDGNIDFIGRRDHQVKIRGYRIELGEIEWALEQHPAIREAAVLVHEESPGDKRLVAYMLPNGDVNPPSKELREFLQHKLPSYMAPAMFITLDAFPLAPGGKVDRRALAKLEAPVQHSGGEHAAPRDVLEERLTQLWENMLSVKPIRPTDNFFEVGGHSLLAIRMIAKIEEMFGARVSISSLFQSPTLEGLANLIRRNKGPGIESPVVAIQPHGTRPPFFCVHTFGGNIFQYRELGKLLAPDQPFYGLQAREHDHQSDPLKTVEDMAAHYIEAMQTVQAEGPYCLGDYCSAGVIAFEMARQLQKQGHKVGLLALIDAYVPRQGRIRINLWNPLIAARILWNFPTWARHNAPGNVRTISSRIFTRLRKNGRTVWNRLGAKEKLSNGPPPLEDYIGNLLGNISDLPESHRRLMQAELEALWNYVPQVYQGRITLFRSVSLPLIRCHDPEFGWGRWTTEGVEIKIVPGSHRTILQLPHVKDLAAQIRESLTQAQIQEIEESGRDEL